MPHPPSTYCWQSGASVIACLFLAGCAAMRGPSNAEKLIHSRQLTMQGITASREGREADAAALFKQAISTCPVDERPRLHNAKLLWTQGEHESAIRQMEEAVRLSAGDPDLRVQLGQMYLELNRLAQAQGQARRAISVSNCCEAWLLQGHIQRRQNNLEEALASYQRALAIHGQHDRALISIADIYRDLERPIMTLAVLDRWLEANPDSARKPLVMHRKGIALTNLRRYGDAVDCLVLAARKRPRDATLLYDLAQAQYLAGDTGGARLSLRESLRIYPQYAPAIQLAHVLERGRPAVATR